jgi:hypothetical protein
MPWVQGYGRYLQAMNPLDKTVQSLARRAGFVDDAATTLNYAASAELISLRAQASEIYASVSS